MTDQVGYSTTEDRTMPAICYALYLLAFATGITAVIGVIIAYAQRSTAGPVMRSHYTFLIRTFWLGLLLAIVGGVVGGILMGIGAILTVILIGFPIMALAGLVWCVAAVWFGIRCIVGLIHLSRGDAYPRPDALLV
ncbi:DUF4870 family protein [Phenylobacterium sp.]|uniref:DUF4870 family protein n=1 Tax=Phenylobacterium sp. TaxID=1871053 RepID=UPI001219EE76|nr:hypothetical protein [Phenylobacterium sp.]TAL30471.1 MAG: hypothetical protein EPN98_17510 [Phenylobacterium sp.]